MKYKLLQLCDIISDKNVFENLINRFSCPINADVENFLKDKAAEYERKNLSRTYFVFYDDGDTHILGGYFSLALITLDVSSNVSRSIIRKISGNEGKKQCVALLLGQLGKNHKDDIHRKKLITGKQLLGIAQNIIRDIQNKIGGRTLLVECKDCGALRNFYEECGFKLVNKSLNEDLLRYFISI